MTALGLTVAAAVFVVDLASKAAVRAQLTPHRIAWSRGRLALVRLENPGTAWGVGAHSARLHALVTAIVLLSAVGALAAATLSTSASVGLGLLAGGAAGNLLDRVRRGTVTDFLCVRPLGVFNLADVALTVAVVVLLAGW